MNLLSTTFAIFLSATTTLCYKAPVVTANDLDLKKPNTLGKKLFEASCVSCHGPIGYGDGTVQLNPKPQPLREGKMKTKVEYGAIYNVIKDGIANTPMPGFADVYSVSQREALTKYVLFLAKLK